MKKTSDLILVVADYMLLTVFFVIWIMFFKSDNMNSLKLFYAGLLAAIFFSNFIYLLFLKEITAVNIANIRSMILFCGMTLYGLLKEVLYRMFSYNLSYIVVLACWAITLGLVFPLLYIKFGRDNFMWLMRRDKAKEKDVSKKGIAVRVSGIIILLIVIFYFFNYLGKL